MIQGTFIDGDRVAIQGQDPLQRGAIYEATGSVSAYMMQVLPEDWISRGIKELYELKNSDVTVTAVELNADGSFRMQVTPNNIQMAGVGIAAAIAAGVAISILAGMKVEQVWEVVTGAGGGGGGSPLSGSLSILTVVGVVVLGLYIWAEYKKVAA